MQHTAMQYNNKIVKKNQLTTHTAAMDELSLKQQELIFRDLRKKEEAMSLPYTQKTRVAKVTITRQFSH